MIALILQIIGAITLIAFTLFLFREGKPLQELKYVVVSISWMTYMTITTIMMIPVLYVLRLLFKWRERKGKPQ